MRRALPACLAAALLALPAAASAQGGGAPPPTSKFEQLTLNDRPGEPVSLAVLPDRRVIHTARTGEVRIFDPRTQLNTLAADVPVYEHDEEGLQGVAVDPGFEENRWVYLYYSPPGDTPTDDPNTPAVNEGDAPTTGTPADFERFKGVLRLSRFKLTGGELDLASEQQIIDVPADRGICCHVGGQIDFDSRGNLYLSTGDDTNPFESDSYSPIDERPERNPAFDAQRTAANTNDLRGKLLRIRVRPNGGYAIPDGNLFPRGTPKTRPEIYAMGLRNPFRFDVNPVNNHVYMADYSPDASEADPNRGPAGHGRWMIIKKPGNYGWPYCVTPELGYRDYDFATGQSGDWFNCTRPVNESPRNTGQRVLPPMVQPDVWYSYEPADTLFPELFENAVGGNGIGPMAGPAYQFDAGNPSMFKWPRYYNGQPLFYEWSRDYVKEMRLNQPNGGRLADIRQVNIPQAPTFIVPGTDDHPVDNPMDMEFGPDGALYTIQYGDGFFSLNPDAKLTKVNFVRGNRSPVPKVAAAGQPDPNVPLELLLDENPTVEFSSAGTADPDGDRITYAWDFNADGEVDSREPNASYTYEENGAYDATLTVTDRSGRKASASVPIIVGNKTPVVTLTTSPAPGEPFAFGQQVTYTVEVTDDEPVDCNKVRVTYILGHDQHGHPLTSSLGCSGTITTSAPGHGDATNLRAVFNASYTDAPADPDVPPLTGSDEVVIPPAG
jgi:cytochrome c